ncbi:MAG: hypothetical protein AB7S26_05575 [Sandaracinaceae bacterium]
MSPALRTSILAAAWLAASPAAAQAHPVAHEELVLLLNPMGAQHTLRAGARAALGDQDDLFFDGAHAEAGAVSYASPVFAIQGGYLEVSPLSFLVLRAEFTADAMWAIGMDGAGYYGLDGYDGDVHSQALGADRGGSATGWSMRYGAQLQGAIPLGDGARLILVDCATVNYTRMGEAPFYYSMQYDLVAARAEWLVLNDAHLLVEIELGRDIALVAGLYDNARFVPSSGYVGHQLGPIVALDLRGIDPAIDSLGVFVRGGYYTDHVTRADSFTILGGISIDWDMEARP